MANESQYSDISTLVGNIYEAALLQAREADVMSNLVTVFSSTGSAPRIWSNYTGGTFATVTEATDMTAQTFNPAVGGTLTPVLYGQQFFLTDLRIAGDPIPVQRDAATFLGGGAGEYIDTHLVGLFSSLTGGTVGTAGTALTWQNVFLAQAKLRAKKVTGRYSCVLTPMQWYDLTAASSGVPTLLQNTSIAESIMGGFYQASFSNIDFFTDANITAGTASVGAMFGREAIALDMRRAFRIADQRDESRGGGGYELNATMQYGKGVYRATYGVQMVGASA